MILNNNKDIQLHIHTVRRSNYHSVKLLVLLVLIIARSLLGFFREEVIEEKEQEKSKDGQYLYSESKCFASTCSHV